ncbi:MAG: aminotransferase class V-fold PLP-dependent enzyme [Thermosynechococcaceae cyanobacterium MS004]|nr:aminotransferase class V-fold PLP-dependent enzyme [Thermosynechococcaceae cyanobacterium MS004]
MNRSHAFPTPSRSFAHHWQLDPEVVFLNHGAFGACPTTVLEAQQAFQRQLEREPLRFVMREYEPLLDHARTVLADFVGAAPANLVFVPNATTGVNSVLRSLSFSPGDELLTTNHAYNACCNALRFVAERSGAKVVVAEIPFPLALDLQTAEAQIHQAILSQVSPRTRLVMLDHVSSPTALIFPLRSLIQALAAQGIETLIDGAHAPGMLPLNLETLGATYYTGNCHKWLCAPKGAGFLYVQPERQSQIRPLTISHGANANRTDRSRFQLEFDWTGTQDYSAYLAVATAIDYLDNLLPQGWADVMTHNRLLALQAREILCNALEQPLPCPAEMVGAIAAVPLPTRFGIPEAMTSEIDPLQDWLWEIYQIEVPIVPLFNPARKLIRVSAQIYNDLEQYHYLAHALQQRLKDLD